MNVVGLPALFILQKKTIDPVNAPKKPKSENQSEQTHETEKVVSVAGVRIFYGSQTGTAKVCSVFFCKRRHYYIQLAGGPSLTLILF